MPLPSVETAASLDPPLVAEIRQSLDDTDPQNETLHEHASAAPNSTPHAPRVFVARNDAAFAGYARVHQHGEDGANVILDMIIPREDPETAFALYNAVSHSVPGKSIYWWAQDKVVGLGDAIASQLGLTRTRTVERMERELGDLDVFADVTTRDYTPADAAEIVRVNNDAFAGHVDRAHYTVDRLNQDLERLDNRFGDLRLMEHDRSVSGFVWLKDHGEGIGEVFVLAVDHHHRGTGLGGKLLDAGVVYVREAFKSTLVMLYVESTNTHAIDLYKKHNFLNVHRPRVLFERT